MASKFCDVCGVHHNEMHNYKISMERSDGLTIERKHVDLCDGAKEIVRHAITMPMRKARLAKVFGGELHTWHSVYSMIRYSTEPEQSTARDVLLLLFEGCSCTASNSRVPAIVTRILRSLSDEDLEHLRTVNMPLFSTIVTSLGIPLPAVKD